MERTISANGLWQRRLGFSELLLSLLDVALDGFRSPWGRGSPGSILADGIWWKRCFYFQACPLQLLKCPCSLTTAQMSLPRQPQAPSCVSWKSLLHPHARTKRNTSRKRLG